MAGTDRSSLAMLVTLAGALVALGCSQARPTVALPSPVERPATKEDPRILVDTIARLDSAWARSYAVHDTALAMALFAPDVLIVGGNGSMKSRAREMQDIRPQDGLRMHFFRTSNVIIECYAAACAVVGVAEWEFEYNGRVDRTRRRYSATWVRGGSLGWQMVSLHISPALSP